MADEETYSQKSPPIIMIVDADPQVRKLAGNFLMAAGYKVEYALEGYEALDRARKTKPDVILAEIMLPKLDGLALCRLLKSDPNTQNIRVIVFSELSFKERAQDAGADAFLLKPVEKTGLVNSITNVVNPVVRSTLL